MRTDVATGHSLCTKILFPGSQNEIGHLRMSQNEKCLAYMMRVQRLINPTNPHHCLFLDEDAYCRAVTVRLERMTRSLAVSEAETNPSSLTWCPQYPFSSHFREQGKRSGLDLLGLLYPRISPNHFADSCEFDEERVDYLLCIFWELSADRICTG